MREEQEHRQRARPGVLMLAEDGVRDARVAERGTSVPWGPRYSTRWRYHDHVAAEVGGEHRRVPGVVLDEVGCGAESRRMGSGA
jgi:hypothetical protein